MSNTANQAELLENSTSATTTAAPLKNSSTNLVLCRQPHHRPLTLTVIIISLFFFCFFYREPKTLSCQNPSFIAKIMAIKMCSWSYEEMERNSIGGDIRGTSMCSWIKRETCQETFSSQIILKTKITIQNEILSFINQPTDRPTAS